MLHMNPKVEISTGGAGIFKQHGAKSTHNAITVN